MKLGTENKKAVYILIGLSAFAAYGIYSSLFSGPSSTPSSAPLPAPANPPAEALTPPPMESTPQPAGPPRAPSTAGRSEEFKPKLRSKRAEERIDSTHVDPMLHLDLLAKLQEVPAPGGSHNLFQIGPAPVKVEPLKGPETRVEVAHKWRFPPPLPPPPPPPGQQPKPPPVPINVKYYGWATPSGSQLRKAFFLDGDDVVVKSEGETLKGHYRIVRIGPTSVVVEDANDKLQQTLKKVEDPAA
jgi:hypothetical protein